MRLLAAIVLTIAAPAVLVAQQSGGGGMTGGGMGAGMGQSSGNSDGGGSKRSAADDISAVAPPFDVDDVLRMHRVGLQDEVIIQALRARFHPVALTDADRELLTKNSVSLAVISALEDPFGTGVHPKVEAKAQASDTPTLENSQAKPPANQPDQAASAKKTKDAKADVSKPDPVSGQAAVASESNPRATRAEKTNVPAPAANATGATASASHSGSTSLKPSPAHYQSGPSNEIAKVPAFPVSASMRLPIPNPGSDSAPVAPLSVENAPKAPGIYRRISGGGWAQVSMETVTWKHSEEDPTKHVEGRLYGVVSPTSSAAANADLLIVTPPNVSVVQYQLLKMRLNHSGRDFRPEQSGNVVGGSERSDVLGYNPQRLGPNVWVVSLHDLSGGDYGLLPPIQGELHSTTGFAKSIFTFHVL